MDYEALKDTMIVGGICLFLMCLDVMWIGFYQVPNKSIPIVDYTGNSTVWGFPKLGLTGCNENCTIAIRKLGYPLHGMILKHEYCHVLQWQQGRHGASWANELECYIVMWLPV